MTTKLLFFSALLCLGTFMPLQGQTGTVVFEVSKIKVDQGGEIAAGLFTKGNFPNVGDQFKGAIEAVKSNFATLTINDVPAGTYAAVVFQDVNQDSDLETNKLGFPKEPIGFANGAKIRFGPPSFEAASVEVKTGETTIIKIKLK
ncbi:MAG: DUF2141 domain-containing protein [Bacteroidota bacterium]